MFLGGLRTAVLETEKGKVGEAVAWWKDERVQREARFSHPPPSAGHEHGLRVCWVCALLLCSLCILQTQFYTRPTPAVMNSSIHPHDLLSSGKPHFSTLLQWGQRLPHLNVGERNQPIARNYCLRGLVSVL